MNIRYLLLLLIVFLAGCHISDKGSDSDPDVITDLPLLKHTLSNTLSDSMIVVSYSRETFNGTNITEISFDNDQKLKISSTLIDSLEPDKKAWNLKVVYSDKSHMDLYAVGDQIFREGHFNIEANPSGFNPLSARVEISVPVPGRFRISVSGRTDFGISITHEFDKLSFDHTLPVLGFYQNFNNEIVFEYLSPTGYSLISESYFLQTPQTEIPDVTVNINNLPTDDQGIFFNSNLKMGFDQHGEIRWIWTGPAHYVFRKLQNGNLIITSDEDMVIYHTRRFHEVSMTGEIIKTFETPNYQHHEIREMPNGNFLVASNSTPIQLNNGKNQEDYIIEYDRETGAEVNVFDLNLILDNQRPPIPGERDEDWFHNNSIYFDEESEALIISGRAQCAVISIDYATKEVNWIIGNPNEWSGDLASKTLSPIDENGNDLDVSNIDFWPYGQHAAMKLPNGNILMYDNGRYRGFYDDPGVQPESYSRAIEYHINTSDMTIQKVWDFDANREYFTPFTGDVDYDPKTQHRLISFMWGTDDTPRFFELDKDDNILYEAMINAGSNHYRMEKLDLYDGLHY